VDITAHLDILDKRNTYHCRNSNRGSSSA